MKLAKEAKKEIAGSFGRGGKEDMEHSE